MVCGNIYIDGNTDLSESELEKNFEKLEILNGNLKIEYTSFTSLRILKSLLKFECSGGKSKFSNCKFRNKKTFSGGFFLSHNSKLSSLDNMYWKTYNPCVYNIINNTQLDLTPYCDYGSIIYNTDMNAYGNLKDCGKALQ